MNLLFQHKFKATLLAGLAYVTYDTFVDTTIELYYKDTPENQDILKNVPAIRDRFHPSLWNLSPSIGLTYVNILEFQMFPQHRREIVQLSDGGEVGLDWVNQDDNNIVIIAHGLTGGGDCNYVKDVLYALHDSGFTAVCFNQRGVGGNKLTTPRYHDPGDPKDLSEVIEIVKKKYPNANLYGIGISIGANLILSYAGTYNCQFKAIVSVSNPYDLVECHNKLRSWKRFIYLSYITHNFKWLLNKHLDIMKQCIETHGIDIERAFLAETPEEFHEYFTKRLFNYENVNLMSMYYFYFYQKKVQQHSCIHYLYSIQVPVLCINAKNDPICHSDHIPTIIFKNKPNLILALTKKGGHVEWFESNYPFRIKRWINRPIIQYLTYQKQLNTK